MPTLVNVEFLEFKDLIPVMVNDADIMEYIDDIGREEALKILREKFDQLKNGNPVDMFLLGNALIETLRILGRVFMDIEGMIDDYRITPIKLNDCIQFINSMIHKEGFQNA